MPDKLRRLFAPELPEVEGELELPSESAHHARVLRLTPGTQVQLFDGRAHEAAASVIELSRTRLVCRVHARYELPAPARRVSLVLGLPKGQKLEDITRMLTELGVSAVHLALTEHSVPRPGDSSARMARLARIALEACAQSGQPRAPELHAPQPLLEIAAALPAAAHKIVFFERAEMPLATAWPEQPPEHVCAVVGPEGGLSEREVTSLRELGFAAVGLGPALLRVETAAPVITALLLTRLGRLQ